MVVIVSSFSFLEQFDPLQNVPVKVNLSLQVLAEVINVLLLKLELPA